MIFSYLYTVIAVAAFVRMLFEWNNDAMFVAFAALSCAFVALARQERDGDA